MSAVAIVLGVSRYESASITPLSGAAADAQRVASSLRLWGMPDNHVLLLTNERATRREILHAVRVWPRGFANQISHVIVYFAGHGARVADPGLPRSSVLLPYDADADDLLGTGIELAELVSALRILRAPNIFLLIDACGQRFSTLPFVLGEAFVDRDFLYAAASSCMFCLVAAGLDAAIEDPITARGLFTDAVLSHLSQMRNESASLIVFAQSVQEELRRKGLPDCEFYMYGSSETWILPRLDRHAEVSGTWAEPEVRRSTALASLQDDLLRPVSLPIWLTGVSGIGKTVLVRQAVHSIQSAIYVSAPRDVESAIAEEYLLGELARETGTVSVSLAGGAAALERSLLAVSRASPGTLIVFDHCERLSETFVKRLIGAIQANPSLSGLLVSQSLPPPGVTCRVWQCPYLNLEEVAALMRLIDPKCKQAPAQVLSACGGSPMELRAIVLHASGGESTIPPAMVPETDRAMAAVAATGGYLDEKLLCSVFGLQPSDVAVLHRVGLIRFQGGRFLPHDSLVSWSKQNSDSSMDALAIQYWKGQLESHMQDEWAALMLCVVFLRCGTEFDVDDLLRRAFEIILRESKWQLCEALGMKLLGLGHEAAQGAVLLAEHLVRVTRYLLPDSVVRNFSDAEPGSMLRGRICLIESERSYWSGEYEVSVECADQVLRCDNLVELHSQALLNKAIAHFFLGEWQESLICINRAMSGATNSARITGWCMLICGSIVGILGTDATLGARQLQSAIRILAGIGDYAGTASAWNNIGERSWKCGEYRNALVQLERASELAEDVDDQSTILEVKRNTVHLLLRLRGPYDSELSKHVQSLEDFMRGFVDKTEAMQCWNTLATVAGYRLDVQQLETFVEEAWAVTIGNREYHVYSLANRSILSALKRDLPCSLRDAQDAIALAAVGGNRHAMSQFGDDLRFIGQRCADDSFAELERQVDHLRYANERVLGDAEAKILQLALMCEGSFERALTN